MSISNYHQKYIENIDMQTPVTVEDVLKQIKTDYDITDPEDIVYAKNKRGDLEYLISKLIQNRTQEPTRNTRIINEYYYRNKILTFFPKAKEKFIRHWNKINYDEAFTSESYKKMIMLKQNKEKPKQKEELPDFMEYFKK